MKMTEMGGKSFLYEMTPIYIGGNNENDRVASPESVPIHLISTNLILGKIPHKIGNELARCICSEKV